MSKKKEKKNPAVHARVSGAQKKPEPFEPARPKPPGIANAIAGDTLCNRGWPWRNARKHFPGKPLLVTVDRYYPNAKGGPLLVDEPVTVEEERLCQQKQQAIRSEGLRYIIITRDMGEDEARAQLAQVDAARQAAVA